MESQKPKTKSNTSLRNLSHLYLNGRELNKVCGLKNHKHLKVAYLHDNRITVIQGLDKLTNLTHLYLQWNNLTKLENLNHLRNLQKLFISYNQIQRLENTGGLKKLKELHINNQELLEGKEFEFEAETIDGLSGNLEVLNISKLNLTKLDAIKSLVNLIYLDASKNKFGKIEDIAEPLGCLISMEQLLLEGCPAQKDFYYRDKVTATAYGLLSLDDKEITANNRVFIKGLEKRKKERQYKLDHGELGQLNESNKVNIFDGSDMAFKFLNQEQPLPDITYQRFSEDYLSLLYKPRKKLPIPGK